MAGKSSTFLLRKTPCNGYLEPGDTLDIMFLADLFDKFKGVRADVTFAYEGEQEVAGQSWVGKSSTFLKFPSFFDVDFFHKHSSFWSSRWASRPQG